MKVIKLEKEFIMEEDRDFDSGHASTLIELRDGGILASWFGGSWEKDSNVAIWISRRINGVWSRPVIAADERGIAMWNPVLFRRKDGTLY